MNGFPRKLIYKALGVIALLFAGFSAEAQSTVKLSGYITAAESGECLIGAVVQSGDSWAVSNSYGYYTLDLPCGLHTLKCSYLGRNAEDVSLEISKDTTLDFAMTPQASIAESVVKAEADAARPSAYTGVMDIPAVYIKEMPAILGEPDLLKTLQKMPGVQSGMEGFAGIYVRGGGSEENLIMLDGVPLYNATHMLGLFSTFTPEAVKNVTLYKGFFPAKYGGRASSVIDVRTKEGNTKDLHGTVSVGLLDDRIYVEGPIVRDKTSFSFSVRGMNSYLLYPVFKLCKSPYFFSYYDITGKVTHRFGNSDKLYVSVYHGRDKFKYSKTQTETSHYYDDDRVKHEIRQEAKEQFALDWGNTMASARWNHRFGASLFSDLSVSWSNYRMKQNSFEENMLYNVTESGYSNRHISRSEISDVNAVWDFEYRLTRRQELNFGVSHTMHTYVPERDIKKSIVSEDSREAPYTSKSKNTLFGSETSLYLEDNITTGGRFNASIGMRATLFSTQGQLYRSLEPRVAAEFKILDNLSLKGSYCKMSQYVHLLASGELNMPTDLWVPITKNIKPVFSSQYAVGLYYNLGLDWTFSVEGYYKQEQNVLEYKDGRLIFVTATDWEQDVEMGEGTSKGVEFFVQKKMGDLTGMLGYTLAKTDRVFPDGTINYGKPFPFKYDRRHVIDCYAKYRINDRISLNGAWSYASGNMTTASWRMATVTDVNSRVAVVPYFSGRNNYRLPASHRLDISASFRKEKRRGERVWTVGIYNVYCAKNPNWVVTDNEFIIENGEYVGIRSYLTKRTFFTMLPSVSYTFNF